MSPVYNDQGIGKLFPKYIKTPKSFYCPASTVWSVENAWPAEDLNCYVTYHSREAGAVDALGRGWFGVLPLTHRRFERVSFLSCASWRGYCGHKYGWLVWFMDGSVDWYPDDNAIKTLNEDEWFQTVVGVPKVGRASPWVRFDRWKDAVPEKSEL